MSKRPRGVGTDGRKLDIKVLGRLMSYVLKRYRWHYLIVLIGILVTSLASVSSSIFMKSLIDDYITPMLVQETADFTPLFNALVTMACIYLTGTFANFINACSFKFRATMGVMFVLRRGVNARYLEPLHPLASKPTGAKT